VSREQRATRDATVLRILAELSKRYPDPERLLILRTEARESMVDPDLDMACQTWRAPLEATGTSTRGGAY
jgi:hypothetical protein